MHSASLMCLNTSFRVKDNFSGRSIIIDPWNDTQGNDSDDYSKSIIDNFNDLRHELSNHSTKQGTELIKGLTDIRMITLNNSSTKLY